MRWYHYLIIVLAFIIAIGGCSLIRHSATKAIAKQAENLNPIGYLLITHEDGEEHFEVVSFHKNSSDSSDYTFVGVDGRVVLSNNYTFYYY